jgi:uncharacterized repeat protein (TIGR02543 family)
MKKIYLGLLTLFLTLFLVSSPVYAYDEITEFNGKKILGFGDSIAAGSGADGIGYVERIGDLFNMEYSNYAQPGMTVTTLIGSTNNLNYQIDQAIASGEEADYILFNGSTNDATNDTLIVGSITADFISVLDVETLYGAAEQAMKSMKEAWPNAIIIYVRPHNMDSRDIRQDTYGDIIVEVAKKYSIPVVSLYDSEFDTHDDIIKKLYTNDTYDTGTGDGTHPNALGYDTYYVPAIIGKMIETRNIVVPYFDTLTKTGLTLDYNSETGEFTLNGTATAATLFDLIQPRVLRTSETYYIQYFYVSGTPSFTGSNFLRTYIYGETESTAIDFDNINYSDDLNIIQLKNYDTIQLRFDAGTSFTDFVFKIQVELDEFTEYVNPTSSILNQETYSISTVTFDSNGGSNVESINVSDGNLIDQPNSPIKDGYIFYGWYKDINLTELFDFTEDLITQDTTLYAKWVSSVTGGVVIPEASSFTTIEWSFIAVGSLFMVYVIFTKKGRKLIGIK